jgi:hypothetical protein
VKETWKGKTMPNRDQNAGRVSILRRSVFAYLHSPNSVYLTGSSIGIVVATLILLAFGSVWIGGT